MQLFNIFIIRNKEYKQSFLRLILLLVFWMRGREDYHNKVSQKAKNTQ